MKLWIDDIRTPPDGTWFWAKSSRQALDYIYWYLFDLTEISFDHDLGDIDTSRVVVLALEEIAMQNWAPKINMKVHSANPVGRKWIGSAIENINFWNERKLSYGN